MKDPLAIYLDFINAEDGGSVPFDPDKTIKDQLETFDELDFRLATVKFEIEALIEIQSVREQYGKTLREIVKSASERGKVEKSSVPAFLKRKKAEINKIAREMALELQSIFD